MNPFKSLSRFSFANRSGGWSDAKVVIITIILLVGLFFFEAFNFRSTSFSFKDILGTPTIGPMYWATALAIAFCCLDFAGLARIFTPGTGEDEPAAVWYLFGAWFLAAAFNAVMTWWGVEVAMLSKGESVVVAKYPFLHDLVPVIMAGGVLVIRVLLINSFAQVGDQAHARYKAPKPAPAAYQPPQALANPSVAASTRTSPKPTSDTFRPTDYPRPGPKN